MGLISRFSKMRMKDPREGTLSVVSINMPSPTATSQNYRIDGVVTGPGFPPTAVVHHGVASVNKWPNRGDTLPITFDLSKPTRLTVHWDRLSTGRDEAEAEAAALAERMRASSSSAATGAPPPQSAPPGSVGSGPATAIPGELGALDALLESGSGNVIRLDANNPETAALREAVLRAVGQLDTPPSTGPVATEPS